MPCPLAAAATEKAEVAAAAASAASLSTIRIPKVKTWNQENGSGQRSNGGIAAPILMKKYEIVNI